MTYRELFYKATRLINKGDITLGEYEEMTKPLDREIYQEPVFDKIRAEIENLPIAFMRAGEIQKGALKILDKYRVESEG